MQIDRLLGYDLPEREDWRPSWTETICTHDTGQVVLWERKRVRKHFLHGSKVYYGDTELYYCGERGVLLL
jgi:hypothetical protein